MNESTYEIKPGTFSLFKNENQNAENNQPHYNGNGKDLNGNDFQVSAWLTTQSGRSITHDGLKKRIDVERKRKRLTTIKRKFAERLQKALREIEILETERVGYYSYEGGNTSPKDTSSA